MGDGIDESGGGQRDNTHSPDHNGIRKAHQHVREHAGHDGQGQRQRWAHLAFQRIKFRLSRSDIQINGLRLELN